MSENTGNQGFDLLVTTEAKLNSYWPVMAIGSQLVVKETRVTELDCLEAGRRGSSIHFANLDTLLSCGKFEAEIKALIERLFAEINK